MPTPTSSDPRDFSTLFNTQLSPEQEASFQTWAQANNRVKDTYDYDMRGAFQEMQQGGEGQAENGHFTDKYKKPNHPTFSDESMYHGTSGYTGGQWVETPKGTYFSPGQSQQALWPGNELQAYFQKVEPDIKLLTPDLRDRLKSNAKYGETDPLTDQIAKARNLQILNSNGL